MVKTRGSSQSCCSNSDAGGYTRTARESMTETICSSCHATINPVVGVSKSSSSGITPSLGKRNPRAQVPGHPSDSDNFECCRALRHCGFLGIGAGW